MYGASITSKRSQTYFRDFYQRITGNFNSDLVAKITINAWHTRDFHGNCLMPLPLIALLLVSIFSLTESFAGTKMTKIESVSGRNVLFLEAALPEIKKRKLNLELYRVSFKETAEAVIILMHDIDTPAGSSRGSSGKHPAYEIEMHKETKKILKSAYVR